MKELHDSSPTDSPGYWLVVKYPSRAGNSGAPFSEAVMLDIPGSKKALAVFGFSAEAHMFAGALEPGWAVEKFSSGSLLALLRNRYPDTSHVALDPLPGTVVRCVTSLQSVSREYFAYNLVRQSQREEHHNGRTDTGYPDVISLRDMSLLNRGLRRTAKASRQEDERRL